MKDYSLVILGIITTLGGTFLVNTVGLTDNCSSELTAKTIEFAPMVLGSVMAYIGRFRQGDITAAGFKK